MRGRRRRATPCFLVRPAWWRPPQRRKARRLPLRSCGAPPAGGSWRASQPRAIGRWPGRGPPGYSSPGRAAYQVRAVDWLVHRHPPSPYRVPRQDPVPPRKRPPRAGIRHQDLVRGRDTAGLDDQGCYRLRGRPPPCHGHPKRGLLPDQADLHKVRGGHVRRRGRGGGPTAGPSPPPPALVAARSLFTRSATREGGPSCSST